MDSCDSGKRHLEKILEVIYKKYVQTCEWKNISDNNYNVLSSILQPWTMDNKQYDQDSSVEDSLKICTCSETLSSKPADNELEKKIVDDIDKVINKAKLIRISKDKKNILEKSSSTLRNKIGQTSKDSQSDYSPISNNSSVSKKSTINSTVKESNSKSTKSMTLLNPLGTSTYKKDFSLKNSEKVIVPKTVNNFSMYKKATIKTNIPKNKTKLPSDVPSSTSSEKTVCSSFHNKVPFENSKHNSFNVPSIHLPSCPLLDLSFQKNMKVSSTTTDYTNLEQALDILGIPSDLVKCLKLYYNYVIDLESKKNVDVKSTRNKNKFLEKLKQVNEATWIDQEGIKLIGNIRLKKIQYSFIINPQKINYKEVNINQIYSSASELKLWQDKNNDLEKSHIYQCIANVIKDELFDLNLKLDKKTYVRFYQFFKHIQSFCINYQTNTAVVLDS